MLDIYGKTVKPGWAVYESEHKQVSPTGDKREWVKKLLAVFDSKEAAMSYIVDKADECYFNPLEYNRVVVYKGRGIRFEHCDYEGCEDKDDYCYEIYALEGAGIII